MIIIFGFGEPKTYHIGPIDEHTCTVCKQKAFHELVKITEWFSLFFIRVFPQRHKYFSVCPHCNAHTEISKEMFEKKMPLAQLNKAAQQGELTKEEYHSMLNELQK